MRPGANYRVTAVNARGLLGPHARAIESSRYRCRRPPAPRDSRPPAMTDRRRRLPSVNTLLEREAVRALLGSAPRSVVVDAVRATIEHARSGSAIPTSDAGVGQRRRGRARARPRPSCVTSSTGPASSCTRTWDGRHSRRRDRRDGARRRRVHESRVRHRRGRAWFALRHCVALLRELTGAEDALVVNNNAAALVLVLNTFAAGRDAVVSRAVSSSRSAGASASPTSWRRAARGSSRSGRRIERTSPITPRARGDPGIV